MAKLALYGNTPLPQAAQTPLSLAQAFFGSDAFADHMKAQGSRADLLVGIAERINGVIKGLGSLAKIR